MDPGLVLLGERMKPRTLVNVGGTLLIAGSFWGLLFAPAEVFMGEVYRIFYIHVPTAWNGLLLLTAAFVCAVMYLLKGDLLWDDRLEASMEAGVVLSALLTIQGSIWARPTWGVWWNWDPRLTTTAILVFAFAGILALRQSLKEPRRRAMVSAVATIVAAADVPLVYFSVRFWNSLAPDPVFAGHRLRRFRVAPARERHRGPAADGRPHPDAGRNHRAPARSRFGAAAHRRP
jgi:heme exporter protein C